MMPRSMQPAPTAGGEHAEPLSPWPLDEDYWLCRCEGFAVDGPQGRVGVVNHVRFRSQLGRPDVLAVRQGVLRPHTVAVPVGDVVEVRPSEERLVIRGEQRAHAASRFADLGHILHAVVHRG